MEDLKKVLLYTACFFLTLYSLRWIMETLLLFIDDDEYCYYEPGRSKGVTIVCTILFTIGLLIATAIAWHKAKKM